MGVVEAQILAGGVDLHRRSPAGDAVVRITVGDLAEVGFD